MTIAWNCPQCGLPPDAHTADQILDHGTQWMASEEDPTPVLAFFHGTLEAFLYQLDMGIPASDIRVRLVRSIVQVEEAMRRRMLIQEYASGD